MTEVRGQHSDATAKGTVRVQEPTRAERATARRGAESRATVPDFELAAVLDATALRAAAGPPSLTALLVRAAALALREHPRVNAAYRDGAFELYSRVNVGVALGPTTPTVTDADAKTAAEIDAELRALETAVRAGTITSPELAGATFTVYDLGSLGVASGSLPVIPPQAAMLAAGAVREVPVVRDGAIFPGHEMTLTLACDQRILDVATAAGFLTRLRALLERPEEVQG